MPGTFGGDFDWRLEVEAWGVEPVTDPSMEQILADGRIRQSCLKRTGLRIEDRSRPHKGMLEGSTQSFNLVEHEIKENLVQWCYQQPTLRTWLVSDVAESGASTISVLSTAGFSNGDVIQIGTEAFLVNVSNGTTFTITTRGYWGTEAQAHYVGTGANIATPAVTLTRFLSFEGRRCNLWMYDDDADRAGNGEQVWRGTLNGGPKLSSSNTMWSMSAKSVAESFNRDLGSDLEAPTVPRGIYYPTGSGRFQIECWETSSTRYTSDPGTDVEIITLSGHYETQQDFCDALNTELAGLTIFTGQEGPTANVDELTGTWRIDFVAHASSPKWFKVRTRYGAELADGEVSPLAEDRAAVIGNSQNVSLYAGTTDMGGTMGRMTGKGTVPRGVFGISRAAEVTSTAANVSPLAIWPSSEVSVAAGDTAVVEWPDGTSGEYSVDSVSTSEGYVDLRGGLSIGEGGGTDADLTGIRAYYSGYQPSIDWRKTYVGVGNFHDFIDKLLDDSATEANKGAMPRLTANDLQQSGLSG
ncbi:MAG: hypothetical protein ACPGVG_19915, partial [Mycobacterium sp.]